MLRAVLPLALVPLLASCQPPDILVRAAFIGNALVFVAADPGESGSIHCWKEGAVIDHRLRPAWQFAGPGTGDCRALFPLHFGRAPDGTETTTGPARLEPGRLYLFIGNATAEVHGAFSFTRSGDVWMVHEIDPDSPAAAALRKAWWERPRPGRPETGP